MKTFYRKLFRVHAWFGLITGIFLLILGITGSILVYRVELNQWLYDPLMEHSASAEKIPVDSIYRSLANRYDHLRGLALIGNTNDDNHIYEFRIYTSDDKLYTIDLFGVIVDPRTGKILHEGFYRDFLSFPVNWIFSFHYSFMLGNPGMFATAVVGLTMLVSLITGLMVYRKFIWKVITFRIGIKSKNWRTFSSDLHRVVGVWALLLNALIFFTGFWLNRFMFEPAGWKIKPPTEQKVLFTASVDEKLKLAKDSLPGLKVDYIYLPVKSTDDLSIYGSTPTDSKYVTNTIRFRNDGSLKGILRPNKIRGFASWFESAHYSLHAGNYGGTPVRLLYIIIGLTPGLLTITGFILWWRRQPKSKTKNL